MNPSNLATAASMDEPLIVQPEVAVSPDGRWAVVSNCGAAASGDALTVFDLRGLVPARTIPLGEYRRPRGVTFLPDGRRVAVAAEANQAVIVVDIESGAVALAIATGQRGGGLLALAPGGRRLYVANFDSGTVSLVDLEAGRLVKTVSTGPQTEAIDAAPDGSEVWVGSNQTNRLTILSAGTLDTIACIPSGGRAPVRLKFTPDAGRVLVSNLGSGTVVLFDARRRRPIATVELGARAAPIGILMHPSGGTAWVAAAGRSQVAEINLRAGRLVRYLEAGARPEGLELAPLRP